jgi:hypothetical protein
MSGILPWRGECWVHLTCSNARDVGDGDEKREGGTSFVIGLDVVGHPSYKYGVVGIDYEIVSKSIPRD